MINRNKDEYGRNFDASVRINQLMEIEKISMDIKSKLKEIEEKEEKRNKYKDCMNALKDGVMQYEDNFWHYTETGLFIKLPRKDSVITIQKDIEMLIKDINVNKKDIDEMKKKLVRCLPSYDDVKYVDPEVVKLIENEVMKKFKKNQTKDHDDDEDDY
jgi:hypothetical protein